MRNKDYDIRWKTILSWFLFRVKISHQKFEGKHAYVQYKYEYKLRPIPGCLFFLVMLIPAIFIGGVPAVSELFNNLFREDNTRSDRCPKEIEMTKTFAYNRL